MSLSFFTNFHQDYKNNFEFQIFSIYGNARKPQREVNRYSTDLTVCANCFNIIERHVANTGILEFRMIHKIDPFR